MARIIAERHDAIAALGECFREHGYAGASLAVISRRTGLGKGSLYHFFPRGKDEMLEAVLADIDGWFVEHVFKPLRTRPDAPAAISSMFDAVDAYFQSGRRVCLVGALALGDARDRFSGRIAPYFQAWIDALAAALVRAGHDFPDAIGRAEEIVGDIQGAIVLSRALGLDEPFRRAMRRLRLRALVEPAPSERSRGAPGRDRGVLGKDRAS
jgi:AcrR family transcriptional regulator